MLRLKSVEEYTHSCYETNVWRACLLLAALRWERGVYYQGTTNIIATC